MSGPGETGWAPALYRRFEAERNRPARDLIAALGDLLPDGLPAGPIHDLGCGPGNSTEALCAAFPDRRISGLDSDAAMIGSARIRLPGIDFQLADLRDWSPPLPAALLFSNAVFHWLPDHLPILNRLIDSLAPGGALALQMPDNLDEPSHRAMAETAADGPWAAAFAARPMDRKPLPAPRAYVEALGDRATVTVWRTLYHHQLPDAGAIVDFVSGAGLRPWLERAASADPAYRASFLAAYRARIAALYPPLADGSVLMAMPRLFVVAVRR